MQNISGYIVCDVTDCKVVQTPAVDIFASRDSNKNTDWSKAKRAWTCKFLPFSPQTHLPRFCSSLPLPSVCQAHCGAVADVRGVVQRGRREGLLAAAPGRLGRIRRHRRHAARPRTLRRQRQPHGGCACGAAGHVQSIYLSNPFRTAMKIKGGSKPASKYTNLFKSQEGSYGVFLRKTGNFTDVEQYGKYI